MGWREGTCELFNNVIPNTMNINSVWYNVIKKSLRSIVERFIIKIIYRLNAKL